MSQSGDPAISETFREIQMEAATLLSARNDATRRAAKAKEAAELVASKQGLAKDPAVVTAANKLFADCEDMRTRVQTRVAKFIQNPLLDHQKKANSKTAATLLNMIHASGILAGTPATPGLAGTKTKLDDNVFDSGRISDATAYLIQRLPRPPMATWGTSSNCINPSRDPRPAPEHGGTDTAVPTRHCRT